MNEIKITWNDKYRIKTKSDTRTDDQITKKELLQQEINNYLFSIRKTLYLGVAILSISGIIMLVSEIDSELYKLALRIAFVAVGVRCVFAVVLNLLVITCRVYFPSDNSWEITERGIIYLVRKREKKVICRSDIRKILIKELSYPEFSIWELQIKDKYRRQYKVQFPSELKMKIYNALNLLKVPVAISDKPARRWL